MPVFSTTTSGANGCGQPKMAFMGQSNSMNLSIDTLNNDFVYYSNGIVKHTEKFVIVCCQCGYGPYADFHDVCTNCGHYFDSCCPIEKVVSNDE
jgi:hypothetical protein